MYQRLEEVNSQISRYNNLLEAVTRLQSPIGRAPDQLQKAESGMAENFVIDDLSADKGVIGQIKTHMLDTRNYISNKVIPEIQNRLRVLENQRQQIQDEIRREEERKAREKKAEEERKAAEERAAADAAARARTTIK